MSGEERPRGMGRGGDRGGGRKRTPINDGINSWTPMTKLGRLVKEGKIDSLEDIYYHSIPIKEVGIVEYFMNIDGEKSKLRDEVMKVNPVQKQTTAGQRTRLKAVVAVGDNDGHVGLGVKCAKDVQTAIQGASLIAKLSLLPVRRGYWGRKIGDPHTVPVKLSGKCGSVRVRIIPAPRGTGLVAAPASKKLLSLAGVEDAYTSTSGCSRTLGNFVKAVYFALTKSYGYLTPDLWESRNILSTPYEAHAELLKVTN